LSQLEYSRNKVAEFYFLDSHIQADYCFNYKSKYVADFLTLSTTEQLLVLL
jgi:hypothetical protein